MTLARPIQVPLVRSEELQPLSTVECARQACAVFAFTEEDILSAIDEGAFEWVWNIGSRRAARREVRIFAPCVQQHLAVLNTNGKLKRRTWSLADVTRSLFPTRGQKPYVRSPELRLAFNCSPDLITTLIDDGDLTQSRDTEYRVGRNGGASVAWPSVTQFLEKRRI